MLHHRHMHLAADATHRVVERCRCKSRLHRRAEHAMARLPCVVLEGMCTGPAHPSTKNYLSYLPILLLYPPHTVLCKFQHTALLLPAWVFRWVEVLRKCRERDSATEPDQRRQSGRKRERVCAREKATVTTMDHHHHRHPSKSPIFDAKAFYRAAVEGEGSNVDNVPQEYGQQAAYAQPHGSSGWTSR
jgi:hypothetical protein